MSPYLLLSPWTVGNLTFLDSSIISSANCSLCEGELTLDKCKAAVEEMARGKTLGVDGLPAEFYQRFWPLLGQDFVDVIFNNICQLVIFLWLSFSISAFQAEHSSV